jgi:hypothetical protein
MPSSSPFLLLHEFLGSAEMVTTPIYCPLKIIFIFNNFKVPLGFGLVGLWNEILIQLSVVFLTTCVQSVDRSVQNRPFLKENICYMDVVSLHPILIAYKQATCAR